MTLRELRWLAVVVPLLFLAALDVARHEVWPQVLHSWPGNVLLLATVAVGTLIFSRVVFDRIETIDRRLIEQNHELRVVSERMRHQAAQLRALHEAGVALTSNLSLESVLLRVVDLARELASARYGALSVLDERGGIVRFHTSGLSHEERSKLDLPPVGRGLLGAVYTAGKPLRVSEIGQDSRSVGFPPGHPPMKTLLGVPIAVRGRTYGNLYLTDKQGPDGVVPFTPEDEELLRLFATQAAVAMENARLHAEVQGLAAVSERERIARELHDSLAQALGYVRMRVAAAGDALRAGQRGSVREALEQISAVAGEAYGDVREAILGLRSGVSAERDLASALDEYLQRYRLQTGVEADLEVDEPVHQARLAPGAEAQLLRIIQEALANVRKHARAHRAVVRLELTGAVGGPRLRASVADDGQGFDPRQLPAEAHYGLATMRERAESAEGNLSVESAPGQGTRVIVELPIESRPSLSASVSGE